MGKRLTLTIDGSIKATRPDLMAYWDGERNDKDPKSLLPSSRAYIHWICPENPEHRWMARVSSMATDCKCPGCVAGADRTLPKKRKVKSGNSLSETVPEIAEEWYAPYNGSITPHDVNRGSTAKYWWKCSKHGVIWEASAYARVSGHDCPLCLLEKLHNSSSRPEPGKSLGDLYPDLANQWYEDRNGDVTPYDIKPQSHMSVWWQCPYNEKHIWRASPHNRINGGTNCPHCSEWQHTSFPEKAILFYVRKVYPDAIESYNPDPKLFGRRTFDIYIPSIRVAIEYDGQAWHDVPERDISKDFLCFQEGIRVIRVREPECPRYDGNLAATYIDRAHASSAESLDECIRKVLGEICACEPPVVDTKADTAGIRKLFNYERSNKSVADRHPELVEEWVVESNDGMTLDSFRVSSDHVGTWRCPKGHIYDESIRHRCQGHGCRRCKSMKPRKGRPSLREACPKISDEWVRPTDGTTMTPDDIGKCSDLEVLWKCSSCGDEFVAVVKSRTKKGDRPMCKECVKKAKTGKRIVQPVIDAKKPHKEAETAVGADENQEATSKPKTSAPSKPRPRKRRSGYKLSKKRTMSTDGKEKLRQRNEARFLERLSKVRPEIKVLSRYEGCDKPIRVRCEKCGKEKYVNPSGIFRSKMCSGCMGLDRKKAHEEFVDELADKNPNVVAVSEYKSSKEKMTFRCLVHDVEWDAVPGNLLRGCGCPTCKSEALSLVKHRNLDGRSLRDLYPKIADEWVRAVDKPSLDPTMVTAGSDVMVLWRCGMCKGEWVTSVAARTCGTGKPYCKSCKAAIRAGRDVSAGQQQTKLTA